MKKVTRYIFVTGGVLSGLGKGITSAAIGNLFVSRKFNVNIQKCDPYLNVDAGLLNPREHGECYVTFDGAETDLDLGHYERFINTNLNWQSSIMAGRVLRGLIESERAGKFNGQTVQIIPHLTNAIQDYILKASQNFDIHIVEIGGTIGDYESMSFIEAIREFANRVGRQNCLFVHLVYLPFLEVSNEFKTKPAQNSVRDLRGLGIVPDILVARSEKNINAQLKKKLSLFAGVQEDSIALLANAKSIYEVPLMLEDSGIMAIILDKLKIKSNKPDLSNWRSLVAQATKRYDKTIKVGIVAKYLDNSDTYLSVVEALKSAAWLEKTNLNIKWIDSSKINSLIDAKKYLADCQAMIVPGGFGSRGVEGKIYAAQYAFINDIPYLGICYGLHMAVIALARLAGLENANTTEVDAQTEYPVIITMKDQIGKEQTGGTMRLGNYDCELVAGSQVQKLYKKTTIIERHRHRYECNPDYIKDYPKWGLKPVGFNPKTGLVEIIEAPTKQFYVSSQFHPEFTSRPLVGHPLFIGLVESAKSQKS